MTRVDHEESVYDILLIMGLVVWATKNHEADNF
jgi:hypothetical protein